MLLQDCDHVPYVCIALNIVNHHFITDYDDCGVTNEYQRVGGLDIWRRKKKSCRLCSCILPGPRAITK